MKKKLPYFTAIFSFMVGTANAALINGTVNMQGTIGGTAYFSDATPLTQTYDPNQATGIDFNNDGLFNSAQIGIISATGDMASIDSTYGVINDFFFAPTPIDPITPLWASDSSANPDFFFNLLEITNYGVSSNTLIVGGSGTLGSNIVGFDLTEGFWEFSATSDGKSKFGWSAAATSIPAPGVLGLLGLGLIVITQFKRKKAHSYQV